MKKIISILLALIMMFSVTTVAFAEDVTPTPDESTTAPTEGEEGTDEDEPLLGEYDWILDMPFWTVKPALKVAKIALKLFKVVIKVGGIFGFVDTDALTEQFVDFIGGLVNGEDTGAEEATTAPAADAA